jgi:hypothetical protein
MYFSPKTMTIVIALLAVGSSDAFSLAPSSRAFGLRTTHNTHNSLPSETQARSNIAPLFVTTPETTKPAEVDENVQRLKSMAAKLRADAAELEAEQAKERAGPSLILATRTTIMALE